MARTRSSIALLTGLALSAGALAGVSRTEPEDKEPARSIPIVGLSGTGSKVKQAGWVRVTSDEALRTLWSEHTGAEPGSPQPPTVDFERCVVIAYFDPKVPNASGVRVDSITPHELDERSVRVRYDVVQYQSSSFGEHERPRNVWTAPYGFFVIDRYEGTILFDENEQHLLNEPPNWQLRWVIHEAPHELQRSGRTQSGGR